MELENTFPAVVKGVSSRKANHGPGRSAPHAQRKTKGKQGQQNLENRGPG